MSYRTIEEYDREHWTNAVGHAVRSCAELLLDPAHARYIGPVARADIKALSFSLGNQELRQPPPISETFTPTAAAEYITSRLVDHIMSDDRYRHFRMQMHMGSQVRGVPVIMITLLPELDQILPPP